MFFLTTGNAIITSIHLTVVRKNPTLFTFTCTSSGGPVSGVYWTRGATLIQGGVSELNDPVTASYTHSLNNTLVTPGSYICYLNTRVGAFATSKTLIIEGKNYAITCSFKKNVFVV